MRTELARNRTTMEPAPGQQIEPQQATIYNSIIPGDDLQHQQNGGNLHTRSANTRQANRLSLPSSICSKLLQTNDQPIEPTIMAYKQHNSRFLNIQTKSFKYHINKDKALKKKTAACNRPIMCETVENNGKITIICQAGVYELIKRATLILFMESYTNLSRDIELWQDASNNYVQATIKTAQANTGKFLYTVSLYHTSSTLHINGSGTKRFIDNELPLILEIIEEINSVCRNTDPTVLNDNIKQCLAHIQTVIQQPKSRRNKGGARQQETNQIENQAPPEFAYHGSATTSNTNQGLTGSGTSLQQRIEVNTNNVAHLIAQGPGPITASQTATTSSPPETLQWDSSTAQINPPSPVFNRAFSPPLDPHLERRSSHRHPAITASSDSRHPTNATPYVNQSAVQHGPIDTSFDIHTTQSSPDPQEPSNNPNPNHCVNCHTLNVQLQATRHNLNTAERKIKTHEKALTQREKDLATKVSQYASSRTHISSLENQVKQLLDTNKLLQDQIASLDNIRQQHHQAPLNFQQLHNQGNSHTTQDTQDHRDNTLLKRIESLESSMNNLRISQLETQVAMLGKGMKNTQSTNTEPPTLPADNLHTARVPNFSPYQPLHTMHPTTLPTFATVPQHFYPLWNQSLPHWRIGNPPLHPHGSTNPGNHVYPRQPPNYRVESRYQTPHGNPANQSHKTEAAGRSHQSTPPAPQATARQQSTATALASSIQESPTQKEHPGTAAHYDNGNSIHRPVDLTNKDVRKANTGPPINTQERSLHRSTLESISPQRPTFNGFTGTRDHE